MSLAVSVRSYPGYGEAYYRHVDLSSLERKKAPSLKRKRSVMDDRFSGVKLEGASTTIKAIYKKLKEMEFSDKQLDSSAMKFLKNGLKESHDHFFFSNYNIEQGKGTFSQVFTAYEKDKVVKK